MAVRMIEQPPMQQPAALVEVTQWRLGQLQQVQDQLAEEVPVAMVYNGISHVVMLATPQDLEDFALGFSLTEGILQQADELYDIEILSQDTGIELHMTIASERFLQLKTRRRQLAGRTGCGLCGAESLSQVFQTDRPALTRKNVQKVKLVNILKACQDLRTVQPLQQITGATHACAWVDEKGDIGLVREDVGRHNALDKLIGALLSSDKEGGFIVTTSRASYEMVQKVMMAGFNILVAISAPTALAVRMAKDFDITLLGFFRQTQHVVYAHPERLDYSDIE